MKYKTTDDKLLYVKINRMKDAAVRIGYVAVTFVLMSIDSRASKPST